MLISKSTSNIKNDLIVIYFEIYHIVSLLLLNQSSSLKRLQCSFFGSLVLSLYCAVTFHYDVMIITTKLILDRCLIVLRKEIRKEPSSADKTLSLFLQLHQKKYLFCLNQISSGVNYIILQSKIDSKIARKYQNSINSQYKMYIINEINISSKNLKLIPFNE